MAINMEEKIVFCKGGGCTAKLGAGVLSRVLEKLPRGEQDPSLLVGYDSRDDAAVYKISDDTAIVQTLDFFPPMVDDPYTFGQIAAANALSDIYAMGGEVKTALNIVCFPEKMDLNILGEIMRGGSEKVIEAGGTLAGGHSIADSDVKYGLSVMGVVHPDRVLANNQGQPGDKLILTKKLGVGIICTASSAGALADQVQGLSDLQCQAHELQAHRRVPGAGGQLGLYSGKGSLCGPPRKGAEPVCLFRRRNSGSCGRRGRGVPCGCSQGHGSLGQGKCCGFRPCRPSHPLDRGRLRQVHPAGAAPGPEI